MDIAAMNTRILLQENTTVVDEIGNHTNEWVDFYSCSATVSNSTGKSKVESEVGGVVVDNSDISFTVRYCKKAAMVDTSRHRIVWNGEIYNLVKIDYLNLKKRALKFKCEKVRG